MRIAKTLIGLAAGAAVLDVGIAEYFFRRTMMRQHADTSRTIKMSGTDWDKHMPMIQECKARMLEYEHEDVFITSGDGLRLHATWFPNKMQDSKGLILCFHGYTGTGMTNFVGLSDYYLPRGYQMLLVDLRAHGESEGEYVGFGCLDRRDALRWMEYAIERAGEEASIWLHGISMGGATVLMCSDMNLPPQVKGIISESAFTSAWDVFYHVLRNWYHIPPEPILAVSDKFMQRRAGYGLTECNAAQSVRHTKLPILLVHGTADSFVPATMCKEIYENIGGDKEMLLINGAAHAECFYSDREKYESKLTAFLERQEN